MFFQTCMAFFLFWNTVSEQGRELSSINKHQNNYKNYNNSVI